MWSIRASGTEPSSTLSETLQAGLLTGVKEERNFPNSKKKITVKLEKLHKRLKDKKEAWHQFEENKLEEEIQAV